MSNIFDKDLCLILEDQSVLATKTAQTFHRVSGLLSSDTSFPFEVCTVCWLCVYRLHPDMTLLGGDWPSAGFLEWGLIHQD